MKKFCALIAASVMVMAMSFSVMAAESPTGDVHSQEEEQDKSPQTGVSDDILFIELAGAAFAVTALYSAKKAKEA